MPAIKTDSKVQNTIIKYYTTALDKQKIPVIKSSRGGAHLRINYAGDAKALLSKIHPCTLKATDVSISGSYVTQELTIGKDIKDGTKVVAKNGDKIYFILAVSSKGVLKTKDLTPNKLGLAGKKTTKDSFVKAIKDGLAKMDTPENIKAFLMEMLTASGTAGGTIKSSHIEGISDTDINIIAKDFGEMTGAWWYMNQYNKKATAIEYPAEESAPLVDYYAIQGKTKIAISAKANEGAPPSINAIADILKTMKFSQPKKEAARKAIISISDKSTVDGIVDAAKDLGHPGYAWLKKKFFKGNDFTAEQCETALAKYTKPDAVLADLNPFFELIGRAASRDITKRIFDTKAKRWGLIISPLGYSLVDTLNTNETYLSALNDAAKTIVVEQIYVKLNKSTKTVSYIVKQFSSSGFKFEYNANAGQPSLKKISFKMDKKA
jgi:hypothetical protein